MIDWICVLAYGKLDEAVYPTPLQPHERSTEITQLFVISLGLWGASWSEVAFCSDYVIQHVSISAGELRTQIGDSRSQQNQNKPRLNGDQEKQSVSHVRIINRSSSRNITEIRHLRS
jgi:hypothetical protein